MVEYNTRENWNLLYEKFKTQRDDALTALKRDPKIPTSDDTLKTIWNLCVAVANEVKGNHNQITSGRNGGSLPYSVIGADMANNTISVKYKDSTQLCTDVHFQKVVEQCKKEIEGTQRVFTKTGSSGPERFYVLSLRNVLPMLSLGIFEKGGKNWIEFCHSDVKVGDVGDNAISLSGHLDKATASSSDAISKSKSKYAVDDVDEIKKLLELRKNVILEGVPGTGKTWIRDKVKAAMDAEMEVVTFHPASSYEEFVGGIFPTSSNDGDGTLLFEYQEGTLSRFANRAMGDKERDYILFIDEINRANIPLVMGELLTIIESTKRTKPSAGRLALSDGPNSDGDNPWEVAVHVETDDTKSKYLRLPSNLYILATMNTSDRSVVSMDAALRRRFAYYRIETKLITANRDEMRNALKHDWLGDKKDTFDTVFNVLAEINQHLETSIGPDAMLGHSYLFFKEAEVADLDENQVVSEMMELNTLPQIADTLTSMNKTDQSFVDSTNDILRKMPESMLRHELKAPTSGGKSLDIAVIVCERTNSSKTNPERQYPDDEIFIMVNTGAGSRNPNIPNGKMVLNDSKFIVLKGSGTISPEIGIRKNMDMENPSDNQIDKLKKIREKREKLIEDGVIKVEDEEYGTFLEDHIFDSINAASQMVRGQTVAGGKTWKRETDGVTYSEANKEGFV